MDTNDLSDIIFPLFENIFILRQPRVADSDYIIKIAIMFMTATFKDLGLQKNRNYGLKCSLYLYFLI